MWNNTKDKFGVSLKNDKKGETMLCCSSALKNWKYLLDLSYYFSAFYVQVNYKFFPR